MVALDEQGRASFQRLATADARSRPGRGTTAREHGSRRVHDLRRALARRPFDVGRSDIRNGAEPARAAAPARGRRGRSRRPGSANGPAAVRRARSSASRASSRSGSTRLPAWRRRSSAWRKVKNHLGQEFVVGGWIPGEAGAPDGSARCSSGTTTEPVGSSYAGKVGTGFTDAELERLAALLEPRAREPNPFSGRGVPKAARFVEPELVAQVRFTEWTDAGRIPPSRVPRSS